MLNLPQPRLPTPTVFDGTSPTFPEWARELRAYLNISQFEYINLFDFAYDAEEPLTTDIMVLQTAAGARQGAEIIRHRARIQALQDERALPQAERREHGVIDPEIQQATNDLNAQQLLQDATTTAVRRAGELFGYLIMHATKPGSEPNNLLRRLQRTNIGWEMFRQLRHQYAAGARVQQYTLLQGIVHPQPRWTETSQQQQFQKWIQDISAYEMIHPVIDDALKVSTAINNLRGPIQQHLLLQVRPHHTWQEVRQMIDNFFANSYMHLPGQTIGNIDQDINIVKKEGQRQERKRKRKERKRKGLQQQLLQLQLQHYNTTTTTLPQPVTTSERKIKRKRSHREL